MLLLIVNFAFQWQINMYYCRRQHNAAATSNIVACIARLLIPCCASMSYGSAFRRAILFCIAISAL